MSDSHTCYRKIIKQGKGEGAGEGLSFSVPGSEKVSLLQWHQHTNWRKGAVSSVGNVTDRGDSKGKGPQMWVCGHVIKTAVSLSCIIIIINIIIINIIIINIVVMEHIGNAYFVPEIILSAFHGLTLLSYVDFSTHALEKILWVFPLRKWGNWGTGNPGTLAEMTAQLMSRASTKAQEVTSAARALTAGHHCGTADGRCGWKDQTGNSKQVWLICSGHCWKK